MRLLVISDPHFASDAEKARHGWERRAIRQPLLRMLATVYRRFFWLADPTAHNGRLDDFLSQAGEADLVVVNGDYSCDSGFVGLSDNAAFASANECLDRLRGAFGSRLLATYGDHELGKMSLFGGVGGPKLASWNRCREELRLEPVWTRAIGRHVLMGVTSTLLALDVFQHELVPGERVAWEQLRDAHLADIRRAFEEIGADQRVLLFCHDPTALPFLARESWMARHLARIEFTVIGHLHSEIILRTSHRLAGMPELGFLGNTARRLSGALRRARAWAPFRLVLCPSLAGVQLLKDGGYLELHLDPNGREPTQIERRHLPWPAQDPNGTDSRAPKAAR